FMCVFALYGAADAVFGVEQLGGKALGHRPLATTPCEADDPPDRQRVGPLGPDLDGHLVRGTADAPALDLELGLDVVDGPLEGRQGVAVGAGGHEVEGLVDDGLGGGLLAALQDLVDDLGDEDRPVDRVGHQLAAGSRATAGHRISLPSWRRSCYGPACGRA